MVSSYGRTDKLMWFKQGKRLSVIRIRHGATVILSKKGGGVVGDIFHATTNNEGGWILAFELSMDD